MTAAIRRYRDRDRAAVYDVCIETADAGRSARDCGPATSRRGAVMPSRRQRDERERHRFYARAGFRPLEVPGEPPGAYLVRPTG